MWSVLHMKIGMKINQPDEAKAKEIVILDNVT